MFNWQDREQVGRIERKLDLLFQRMNALANQEDKLMAKIDDVAAAVAEEKTVEDSAIALLNQLTQMIKDAGTDPVKLDAVVASLQANKQALADAVMANTPAA